MMQQRENKAKVNEKSEALDTATTRRILRQTAEEIPQLSPTLFSRIEQAISREDSLQTCVPPLGTSFLVTLFDRLRILVSQPGVAWGVAAVQAVVLCLFVAFSSFDNSYQTLSDNQAELQSAALPSFTVMFHDNATIKEIETLLDKADATIINGPGKQGVYIIIISHTADKNRDESLHLLKTSSLVTFIEQIY